ncbi:hypothetical protein HanXRQr2_Chr17g0807031 [Helianthus annuus]|uniref:Uncharacterized protein n=1 Tax=Helianthus annuus TaxID=4232 RepID=A0A9K3DKF3_HELAN|nr:hypothetical protein HanXRQr2_Chr17g0807031 [Helianthus annuus]
MNRVSIEFKAILKRLQLPPWPSCQWDEVVSVTLWDEYIYRGHAHPLRVSLRRVKHSLCCAHGPHRLR